MKARAVSFDADGTLLGTFTDRPNGFSEFFLEAARSRGKLFSAGELQGILDQVRSEERNRREDGFRPYVSGESARTHWLWFYETTFRRMGLPDAGEMAVEFLERYETGEFTSPYPDVIPVLEWLQGMKIPMILISNFSPILLAFLREWNLDRFFKALLVSGIEGMEKSDRALFEKGAWTLSIKPSEILHVGNEPVEDYHAARQAGFQALLLDREGTNQQLGLPSISSLAQLIEIFR